MRRFNDEDDEYGGRISGRVRITPGRFAPLVHDEKHIQTKDTKRVTFNINREHDNSITQQPNKKLNILGKLAIVGLTYSTEKHLYLAKIIKNKGFPQSVYQYLSIIKKTPEDYSENKRLFNCIFNELSHLLTRDIYVDIQIIENLREHLEIFVNKFIDYSWKKLSEKEKTLFT